MIAPKNAPDEFLQRAAIMAEKIEKGEAKLRKTARYGYKTVYIGNNQRGVLIDDRFYTFNQHSQYEKFINQRH